ncbi:MAG: hypothetical protein ABWZ76_14365 [Acidimicrobiales bacterium]
MPWCETCDRFFNPNTLQTDGTCPTCGRQVAEPPVGAAEPEAIGAPWHFKLLLGATAVYLGYRLFEGIVWVLQHL